MEKSSASRRTLEKFEAGCPGFGCTRPESSGLKVDVGDEDLDLEVKDETRRR